MKKFFSNIGCDQKCFSNLKIMTNRLEWDELTFFDCMSRHGFFFFLFGIPRLVGHRSFHLRQQKRQEFQAAPPLHQKRLHYSRYLHDNILHQEDIIKRSLHPHFDVLVGSFFFYTRPLFIEFWYRWCDIILYNIFFSLHKSGPIVDWTYLYVRGKEYTIYSQSIQ